jgi:hypothetical protein
MSDGVKITLTIDPDTIGNLELSGFLRPGAAHGVDTVTGAIEELIEIATVFQPVEPFPRDEGEPFPGEAGDQYRAGRVLANTKEQAKWQDLRSERQ